MGNIEYRRLASELSTDKPYENLYPNDPLPHIGASFVIYANNTRWVLKCWVRWELHWIPSSLDASKTLSEVTREYTCTWLPEKLHIKNIKNIIWKHPNCTKWQYREWPIWVIILFWRLGFRFTSIRY